VSLALVEEDEPTIGIIDLPRLESRYWASDAGAFRNGQEIEVSSPDRLANAVISLGDFAVGPDAAARNEVRVAVLTGLVSRVLRIRMVGSAATDLAWVADGKLDGTIIVGSHSWDLAAGTAIAKGSGATFKSISRAGSHVTIAGSPKIANDLAAVLSSVEVLSRT
jgi:myo-inositol-1(or 4)-monophosphatase